PAGIGGALGFAVGAGTGGFLSRGADCVAPGISVVAPRPFFGRWGRSLPVWGHLSVLPHLCLRGRWIMFGGPVPLRNFLTEAGLAVTALFLYLEFPLGSAIARFVLCSALFAVALIDYDWRIVPNAITFPGTILGLAAASLLMPDEIGWPRSPFGIALGTGVLFVVGYFYELVRGREGVGMGDVWLLAMTGAFLGWPGVVFTLFFGSMLGIIGGLAMVFSGGRGARAPLADPATDLG